MTDRRYYRSDDERQQSGYDRWGNRQQEQFEQSGYRGSGQAGDRYRRDQSAQMGQDYGDYSSDTYSQNNDYQQREYGADRDTWRGTARAQRGTFGSFAGEYGRDPREFGSFTGSDFGGRDFSVPKRNRDYTGSSGGYGAYGGYSGSGYGSGSYERGTGSAGSSSLDREDRGFFERAGDEIASWFGDEDAARRREADHSGYGPANYTRSDERILEDSCDRLTRDWAVDARNVQVTVQNGEVTLDGTVPSRSQKRRAEDCVDDVSGVSNVQNNLRVQAGSQQSAQGTDAL